MLARRPLSVLIDLRTRNPEMLLRRSDDLAGGAFEVDDHANGLAAEVLILERQIETLTPTLQGLFLGTMVNALFHFERPFLGPLPILLPVPAGLKTIHLWMNVAVAKNTPVIRP